MSLRRRTAVFFLLFAAAVVGVVLAAVGFGGEDPGSAEEMFARLRSVFSSSGPVVGFAESLRTTVAFHLYLLDWTIVSFAALAVLGSAMAGLSLGRAIAILRQERLGWVRLPRVRLAGRLAGLLRAWRGRDN
ncbi:MAG TPA: hypothetical protein VNL14_05620 [Candidatus Acidoferrales bacterium]|nr:hypothetical protein [Candidatus Acidoferrales bacterium]